MHNLRLLKKNGELGIIVSDSLITGKDFKIFRETILKEFTVRRIIQLPDKIFNKTEARTHIIFISNAKSDFGTAELFLSSKEGLLSHKITVTNDDLKERMDFHFHNLSGEGNENKQTLYDIGAIIKRGRYSYKELRTSSVSYFHSTHFKNFQRDIKILAPLSITSKESSAKAGDILMCRVGKRIVGKAALLKEGETVISDCIYKITVPKEYQDTVLNSLLSYRGQEWLKAYAHGVCSQVISKSDLQKFPIF